MKILIRDQGGVRRLEEGYASERELQEFLLQSAELIPLDEIELGTPPLLCIGCEVRTSDGSQDLLYVDETGMLTIVETKLKKNPEVRREVVGQILEYAADAVLWTRSDIEERATRFFSGADCPQDFDGLHLSDAYDRFMAGVADVHGMPYEQFIESLVSNLEGGNIRLIIAVDELHPALLRTVEFVNRFSERFEIYLFQLKRFHDAASEANIFVPALFGRVPDPVNTRKKPRTWDRESFLQQIAGRSRESYTLFERLISLCESENAISWGRGATWGTFGFMVPGKDGHKAPAFGASGVGKITLDFKTLSERVDPDLVEQYREALREVPAISLEAVNTQTWRDIETGFLADERAYELFTEAVERLRAATVKRYATN